MPPLTLTVRKPCRLGARFLEPGDQVVVQPDRSTWVVTRTGSVEELTDLVADGLLSVASGDPSLVPTAARPPRLRLCR